jgi:hypothetical protein
MHSTLYKQAAACGTANDTVEAHMHHQPFHVPHTSNAHQQASQPRATHHATPSPLQKQHKPGREQDNSHAQHKPTGSSASCAPQAASC